MRLHVPRLNKTMLYFHIHQNAVYYIFANVCCFNVSSSTWHWQVNANAYLQCTYILQKEHCKTDLLYKCNLYVNISCRQHFCDRLQNKMRAYMNTHAMLHKQFNDFKDMEMCLQMQYNENSRRGYSHLHKQVHQDVHNPSGEKHIKIDGFTHTKKYVF